MDANEMEKQLTEAYKGARKMKSVEEAVGILEPTYVMLEGVMTNKRETLTKYNDASVTSYHFELSDKGTAGEENCSRIPCSNNYSYDLNTILSLSDVGDTITVVGKYNPSPDSGFLKVERVYNHKYLSKKKDVDLGFEKN